MVIHGVAVLAGCTLVGLYLGDLLGTALGLEANVGGVGIAMLLMIACTNGPRAPLKPGTPAGSGVDHWGLMYIPIIVAMAAQQNVVAAVSGGAMAMLAGVAAVVAGFALVPVLARMARK